MIDGFRLNRLFDCRTGFAIALAAAMLLLSPAASNADDVLTIGDKAPALDIEHWVSDRDGQFSGFTGFEKDKVYIVEFWATWCGPCISSMPHIVETQDEYADKGVQIISVSREKLETVEKFLKRKVRGEKEMTYAELTSAYCLTTDPDGSVSKDYMEAAGQGGIPTAFIVGKTGQIEWIGHPMQMDKPLEEIVADEWDRDAFAKEFAFEQKSDLLMASIGKLMRAGKAEDALEKVDSFLKTESEIIPARTMAQMKSIRASIAMEIGGEVAVSAFKEVIESAGDDAQMINQLTWSVVEQKKAGTEVDDAILKAACEAAAKGVKAAEKDGNDNFTAAMMDTHANLLYLCDKLEDAIAVQRKAAELSDQDEIIDFLEKLEAELKDKDKDKDKDEDEEKDQKDEDNEKS
jgi:thiol-disulfide isomerase/thioredoxin